MKNGGSQSIEPLEAAYGGKVKSLAALRGFAVAVVVGAGLLVGGCKSAPELTAANAQALIQSNYDQSAAVSANIRVDDLGMRQGATAKYWDRSKVYPNKYWADFTLTADGKKVVKLPGGGDAIQWRPDSADDKTFAVMVEAVATNHLKAHDVKDPQDEVGGTKTAGFTEAVNLDGVPPALQSIAHNPGNKLSTRRTATFSLDGGAWKLSSVN